MKKSWIGLIIITSLLITYLFFIFTRSSYDIVGYSYKVGQIADRDIIAPFTFTVYKDEESLTKERESIARDVEPIYTISDDSKFKLIQNIDSLMNLLMSSGDTSDNQQILSTISNRFGLSLSRGDIMEFRDQTKGSQLYSYMMTRLNEVLEIGIYDRDIDQESVLLERDGVLSRIQLSNLLSLDQAIRTIVNNYPNLVHQPFIESILRRFMTPNIIIDLEKTNQALQEAYRQINPVLTEVLENEEIIRKNRRITELDLRKLEALVVAYSEFHDDSNINDLILSVGSYFLYTLLLLFATSLLLFSIVKDYFKETKHVGLMVTFFLLNALFAFLIRMIPNLHFLLLPFSLTVIIFALIFTPIGGLIFSVSSLFLILPFFSWNSIDSSVFFLTAFFVLIIMTKMKDYNDLIPLSIYLLITYVTITTIIALLSSISTSNYLLNLINGLIANIVSITGIILLSPIIEKKLNMATKMILLELLDTNNPLLKRLAIETPGTFHHSITVGVLAESAAEAIGANALLARVGSYYHDIGKLENSQIFIENNSDASELHNKMETYESASNIKNHVLEGISLAKKHNLPQQVIDVIIQHHGDSRVSYFYNKAKEKNEPIEDENQYRYFGPKPKTKEAALVMIADIIESTAKVQMHQHTEESLKKIINDTIQRLILENQLIDTPITLKELETVKSYMLPIITGIYRKRIEYPESKNNKQNKA